MLISPIGRVSKGLHGWFAAIACFCTLGCGGSRSSVAPIQRLTQIAFLTRAEIPSGFVAVRAVVAGNFTADQVPDVVVAGLGQNAIRLLVGLPGGVWSRTAGPKLTTTSAPGDLCAADFDGNGTLDFACAFEAERLVRIYRNDGQGRFFAPEEVRVPSDTLALSAHDVDGDGRADLLVSASTAVQFRRSLGATFAAPARFEAGAGVEFVDVVAADANGDGRTDLVALDQGHGAVVVWYQNAAGLDPARRQVIAGAGMPTTFAVGDADADGFPDILVAEHRGQQLLVFRGNGAGNFERATPIPVAGTISSIAVGDATVAARQRTVLGFVDRASLGELRPLGPGAFAAVREFAVAGLTSQCVLADLDGDARQDVLVAAADAPVLSWLRGLPGGSLAAVETFANADGQASFVEAADFDGDGHGDLIVSSPKSPTVHVLRGRSNGSLDATPGVEVGKRPGPMILYDADRDGDVDVLVSVEGGARLLRNRGGSPPGFTLEPAIDSAPYGPGQGDCDVGAIDVNGDGLRDLVLRCSKTQQIEFRAGDRNGRFSSVPVVTPLDADVRSLATGDFDGDGFGDVAVARPASETILILAGSARGELRPIHSFRAEGGPHVLRSADIDGNGTADLIVSSRAADGPLICSRQGGKFVAWRARLGGTSLVLATGDLNADGAVDVVVADALGSDLRVLVGDGHGGFPTLQTIAGTYRAVAGTLSDRDGDGKPDIVVLGASARLGMYLNRSR